MILGCASTPLGQYSYGQHACGAGLHRQLSSGQRLQLLMLHDKGSGGASLPLPASFLTTCKLGYAHADTCVSSAIIQAAYLVWVNCAVTGKLACTDVALPMDSPVIC